MSDPREAVARLHALLERARPSDLRLGQQITVDGTVEFTTENDLILATVTGRPGTSRRTVRFSVTGESAKWSCTCMRSESPLCKHVVAAITTAAPPG